MLRILLLATLMLVGPLAMAQEPSGILAQGNNPLSIPAITLTTDAEGQQEYSVSLQILLIMTALGFIPAFVMLMTSFTRIIIVFSILRQALGLQQTPSNQILVGGSFTQVEASQLAIVLRSGALRLLAQIST